MERGWFKCKRYFVQESFVIAGDGRARRAYNPMAILAVFLLALIGMVVFRASGDQVVVVAPFPHYSTLQDSTLPVKPMAKTPGDVAHAGWIVDGQTALMGTMTVFNASDALFHMTMATVKHGFPCMAGVFFGTSANVALFRFPPKATFLGSFASLSADGPNTTCESPSCDDHKFTLSDASARSMAHVPANEHHLQTDPSSFLFMLNPVCTTVANLDNPALSFMVSTEPHHLCKDRAGQPTTLVKVRHRVAECKGHVFLPNSDMTLSTVAVKVRTRGAAAACVQNAMDLTQPSIGTSVGMEGVCVPTTSIPTLTPTPTPTRAK